MCLQQFHVAKMTELLEDGSGTTEAMELEHSLAEMTLLEREDEMDADEPEEQMHDHMAIDSIGED